MHESDDGVLKILRGSSGSFNSLIILCRFYYFSVNRNTMIHVLKRQNYYRNGGLPIREWTLNATHRALATIG